LAKRVSTHTLVHHPLRPTLSQVSSLAGQVYYSSKV
jgi:hypothetical protein